MTARAAAEPSGPNSARPPSSRRSPSADHDLDAFAQLIRQLAAPPLMDDEPLPQL
ncbi:Uncharacterised protein [Mycobacterium tuberculosis]|nr:Uncharacterised protein [Mycobacterium tuberculosis]